MATSVIVIVLISFIAYFLLSKIFNWIVLGVLILLVFLFFSGQSGNTTNYSIKSITDMISGLLEIPQNSEKNLSEKNSNSIVDSVNDKIGEVDKSKEKISPKSIADSVLNLNGMNSYIKSMMGQFQNMISSFGINTR